jgi:serine/threonine-protein kinase
MPIQLVENSVVAGRFKLNRLIGRGGMGSVWQATHLGLDIPCAVKFIEGELSQVAEAQTRFEREAKAAAQLRSPHVVQILDHGVCEGTPYIAMELLDGEDLGKRLQRSGRIHPRELTTIMIQVCRALAKAHGLGIVHRDLKPDNIFLVKDDDREIAKVLDFGIAKHNTQAIEGSNTKTGAMLGTPYYMSPEQAQGVKTVDFRSDLWSLAVIVYQCITGVLPFESEALGDLLVRIIVQPLPVPSQVCPDVPPGFDKWWEKAASRDPNGRYQSAKELAESLQLVCGMSSMTDVMDRNQMKGMFGNTPNPVTGGGGPVRTPAAYGATTPHPGAVAAMTPAKFAATTGGAVATPTAPTTGSDVVLPPKRGLGIAVAAGAAILMIGGAITVTKVFLGHGAEPASAAAAQPAAPPPATVAAPTPPPSPAPPPVVTPPASATAAPAATVAEAPAAVEAPKTASHHHSSGSSATSPVAPAKPAPAKPGANAPKDLGF